MAASTWTWNGGIGFSTTAANWTLTAGAGNANDFPAPGDIVIVPAGTIEDGLAELAGQGFVTLEAGAEIVVGAAGDGISLGTSSGTSGTLTVTGAGALLSVGGVSNGIVIGNAGTGDLNVQNNGSVIDTTLSLGGNQTAPAGGKGTLALTGGGDVEVLNGLALWSGSTLSLDGSSGIDVGSSNFYVPATVLVESGQTLTGDGLISAALFNQGVVQVDESHVNGPGTMEITGPVSGVGTFQLAASAVLKLDSSLAGTASFAFPSAGAAELILNNIGPGTISNQITGLNAGDIIVFEPAVTSITGYQVNGTTVTVDTNLGHYVFTDASFAPGAFQSFFTGANGIPGEIQVAPQFDDWNVGSGDLGTGANWSNGTPSLIEGLFFGGNSGGVLTGSVSAMRVDFDGTGTWTLVAGASMDLTGQPDPPFQPYAGQDTTNFVVNGGVFSAAGGFNINAPQGATMTAEGGAQVSLEGLTLGGSPGQEGDLLVTGAGTTWRDVASTLPAGFGGYLTVGFSAAQPGGLGGGVGHVTITAGASLIDTFGGVVGSNLGSEGDVSVTGGGSLSENTISVGQSGTGTLTVNGGTVDETAFASVGQNMGGVGSVSVTNGNFIVGSIAIGGNGNGTVTINSGGTLQFGGTFNPVGQNAGGSGTLQILNGGTAESTQTAGAVQILQIGNSGTFGTLAASEGSVLVSGVGSLLNLNGNGISVGNSGVGSLTVAGGATVDAGETVSNQQPALGAGFATGSDGAITVTGTNSALNVAGLVILGQGGSAKLNVTSNGAVNITNTPTNTGGFLVGFGNPNFSQGTGGEGDVNVSGGGTISVPANGVTIGGDGASGVLNVNSGGEIKVGTSLAIASASLIAGTIYGGTGQVNIGAGSTISITGPATTSFAAVTVGTNNTGLGTAATELSRGQLSVSGTGALLNTGGSGIAVGAVGDGSLIVSQGGSIVTGTPDQTIQSALTIGRQGNGSVTITDKGSQITSNGFVYVGRGGTGNLLLENQGSLFVGLDQKGAGGINFGGAGLQNGNTLFAGGTGTGLVTSGANLTSEQNISVGASAVPGNLTINNGGIVNAGQRLLIGTSVTIPAGGGILLTNSGTSALAGNAVVGTTGVVSVGAGSVLNADADGSIIALGTSDIIVGNGIGSAAALNVSGAGATVNSNGYRIGVASAGQGSLLVGQGGTVLASTPYASDEAIYAGASASATGVITVTDPGSELLATGQFSVGLSGQGSLLIENQGFVTTGDNSADTSEGFDIAQNAGASGTATVTGTKSTLNNIGRFIVGDAGLGSLSIAAGGSVTTSPGGAPSGLVIANTSSASGSSINVSGATSNLGIAGALIVGAAGEGSLSVSQGAVVTAASVDEASTATGDGVITVSGTGSALTLAGTLTVGDQAAGEVSVLNGATVTAQSILVGSANAASSGDVDLEGQGSELIIGSGGVFNVGVAGGGSGVLTIGSGTTVSSKAGVVEAGHGSINNNGGTVDPPFVDITTASNSGLGSNLYDVYVENIGAVQITDGTGTWDTPMMLTGTDSASAAANIDGGNVGEWQLSSGGTLVVNANTVDAGQEIVFEDTMDTLVIGQIVNNGSAGISGTPPVIEPGAENILQAGTFAAPILGYVTGDQILFDNLTVTSATVTNGNTVDLFDNGTALGSLAFFNKSGSKASNSGAQEAALQMPNAPPCFAAGSRIETVDGRVPVEDLRVGTMLPTADGEPEPIVWIAQRPVNCARHPKPEMVWPVRVRAGAFGENLPDHDLYLSPDHAVFLNDVLVPVKLLINGTSITQVQRSSVTYYHVELSRHAVILAEALPVESYLDTGDRADFSNAGTNIRLFPDFGARHAAGNASLWETKGAAPLVTAGAALDAARACLATRAAQPDRRARSA